MTRRRPAAPTRAQRVTVGVLTGVLVASALGIGTAAIHDAYESNRCAEPVPYGWVRNHMVLERPTCRDGVYVVTTPELQPRHYGWNCYYDAPFCDVTHLTETSPFCFTEDDGYTMCQDGRVYIRLRDGSQLDAAVRDPNHD